MEFLKKPRLKRVPNLSEQVAEILAAELENSSIQPGEALPSEAELSERFEVSRTVIREALARLKYDGILESRQGSKSIVAQPGTPRVFRLERLKVTDLTEIGYLYEFRALLESAAAALAAKRRSQKNLEKLRRHLEEMDQAVRDHQDGTAENVDFHMEIVEASGNPFLKDFMRFFRGKIWDLVQADRDHSDHRGLPPEVQQEHLTIFEAINAGNSEKAREAILNHLINAARRCGVTIFNSE
jgi:GntR family transcriptional regulator, transcriptional repressor for pyruvate dehydrogenase complex